MVEPGSTASSRKPERIAAPLRQQVVALLAEAVGNGEYRPGERLVERELCERFDVSRTVVREALRQLESQGLIEIVPNRGPVVATVSVQEATWLYEARAALESQAAEMFARRATAEQKARLARSLRTVAKAVAGSDLLAKLSAKDDFYEVLFEGADNPIIGSLLRGLHARISLLRRLSLGTPGRGASTLAELQGLVAALDAGEASKAAKLARRHVQSAADIAIARLSENDVAMPPTSRPA